MGYGTINFMKLLKGSIANRARISNIYIRKKIDDNIVLVNSKNGKEVIKTLFSKTQNIERV